MSAIFSRVKLNKKQVVAMVIFIVISSIGQLVPTALLSPMINDGVGNQNQQLIITLGIAMGAIAVIACVTNIIAANLATGLTTKFSADIRQEVFYKVQGFSAAEIDKFGSASLITRSTTDVSTIQTFMSMLFRIGLMAPSMAVVGLILSVASAGEISTVLAIAIPILLVALMIILISASRYFVKLRSKIDEINKLFLEALEGVRVIRAFNKQKHEIDRFDVTNDESAKISHKANTVSGSLFPVVNMLFGFTQIAVMAVGTIYVIHGRLAVGTLVSATQYINIILLGIIMMAYVVSLFPDAYACMTRIGEVLDTEVTITDSRRKAPEKTCKGTVEFRNVTFAYPGADTPVVKGISFVSGPGETTAIIGRTGCGKSSIVKLIPRLYDTLFGDVLVDGVNVKDYQLEELRNLIGYVPQKNVLFTGDIASNLNFGNENGTEAEWKEAVRIACAAGDVAV